jgi:hypothetical protein
LTAFVADQRRSGHEAAVLLGLPFRTRQELQRHSFVIGAEQIEAAADAADLEGMIRGIEGR